MRKINQYFVLSMRRLDTFNEVAKSLIEQGWQPYGTLTVYDGMLYQPFISYDKPVEPTNEQDVYYEEIASRSM